MTEITKERLLEIIAGCEGVTPGPWWSDEDGGDVFRAYAVYGPHERYGSPSSICDTHNAGEVVLDQEDGKPWDEQGRKNMSHIARLDPDTVKALAQLALKAIEELADRQTETDPDIVAATAKNRSSLYRVINPEDAETVIRDLADLSEGDVLDEFQSAAILKAKVLLTAAITDRTEGESNGPKL